MARKYAKRYQILTGELAGVIADGEEIGLQDYPGQFEAIQDHYEVQKFCQDKYAQGIHGGIWLTAQQKAIYRVHVPGTPQPVDTLTEEGINYDGQYLDLCTPFDRYGNEIKVGDSLLAATGNEVRRVKVVGIHKKPQPVWGIRKLTVRDEEAGRTLTINSPYATVKVSETN